jgi:hypothetical protein
MREGYVVFNGFAVRRDRTKSSTDDISGGHGDAFFACDFAATRVL